MIPFKINKVIIKIIFKSKDLSNKENIHNNHNNKNHQSMINRLLLLAKKNKVLNLLRIYHKIKIKKDKINIPRIQRQEMLSFQKKIEKKCCKQAQ